MGKVKSTFVCQNCGSKSSKWVGKCPSCEEWNTFAEEVIKVTSPVEKIISGTNLIHSKTIDQLYKHVITQIPFPEEVIHEGYFKETKLDYLKPDFGRISNIEKMMVAMTV